MEKVIKGSVLVAVVVLVYLIGRLFMRGMVNKAVAENITVVVVDRQPEHFVHIPICGSSEVRSTTTVDNVEVFYNAEKGELVIEYEGWLVDNVTLDLNELNTVRVTVPDKDMVYLVEILDCAKP